MITIHQIHKDATITEQGFDSSLGILGALRNAYEQARHNWNWWDYPALSEYPIKEGKYGFVLGDFWVKKEAKKS